MGLVSDCKTKILNGGSIDKNEALLLCNEPLEELCAAADEIRKECCGNRFDMCTIINGKSGKCSENCKYCAQSAYFKTNVDEYGLLDTEEIVKAAKNNSERGVLRFSIVTSGKRLSDTEIDKVCRSIEKIKKDVNIEVCVSFGLLNEEQFRKIKNAGASRVHCNLESSERYFPNVCTTHTFEDKLDTINAARKAGLSVCSGGIMGLGETMEDRIDMAFTLRNINVKSIPVNFLNPIKGTPCEKNELLDDETKRRVIAIYRFIIPDASIRMAGGRGLIADKGVECFKSGANAAITGDMLTTSGITIETDHEILKKLGYEVVLEDTRDK